MILKDEIKRNLPQVKINKDDLYIYIRAGDSFYSNVRNGYIPSPYCFYERVITKFKFNDIYIISIDDKHPAIGKLMSTFPKIKHQSKNVKTDIALLMNAYNLANSMSSFTQAAISFNDNLENLFDYEAYKSRQAILHFHYDIDKLNRRFNVYRMKLLGSEVIPVKSGTATLKDAVSEAMREWTKRIDDTHYCLGSVMGPHPFPTIVRDFQAVISKESRKQILEKENKLPDAVIACVGGGSNAIGSFYHFIDDKNVRLIGCEAAGRGIDTFETAATISTGRLGIFHGMKSYFCQDEHGQIAPVYSISAGLDYPGVGPEHAYLHDIGRAEYVAVTDDEAVNAFEYLSKTEGIIPAIESAHAVAYAMKLAPTMDKDKIIIVTISGRGDKDCAAIARYKGEDIYD